MNKREVYAAALVVKEYCSGRDCENCIFKRGPRGNVMTDCKICGDPPEYWDFSGVKRRAEA